MHKFLALQFKNALAERELMQRFLIKKTKIEPVRMCRILSGNHEIRLDEAFKISMALKLDFCAEVRKAIAKENKELKSNKTVN